MVVDTNDESLSLLQAVRKWPRITIISFSMSLAILCWGYDSAIVGNVSSMPQFQKVYGLLAPEPDSSGDEQYIIPSTWYSLWSIASPVGALVGALFAGWFQDITGRRRNLGLAGLLIAAAVTVCFFSDLPSTKTGRCAAFFVGKLFEGFAIGSIGCTTQTYLSEIVPTRLRGPVMALFPTFTLLGQLIAALVVLSQLHVEGKTSYKVALATEWPFSLLPVILAFTVPESPVWYLNRDRPVPALKAYRRLHSVKQEPSRDEAFGELRQTVLEEQRVAKMNTATYMDCFRGTNRRRSLIIVFAQCLPELFGLSLLGHASYFLQLVGLTADESLLFLIVGVVLGLISNFSSFWTLSRFGRRTLTLATLPTISVVWLSIGIAGIFTGVIVAWYTGGGMMVIIITAGLGVWPASYAIAAETSSLRLRSKSQGIGFFAGGVARVAFGFGSPYLYNLDAGALGSKTGFVFCGIAAIGAVMSWFFVPEMKGRTSAEIDKLFEAGTSAKDFGSTSAAWERLEGGEGSDVGSERGDDDNV